MHYNILVLCHSAILGLCHFEQLTINDQCKLLLAIQIYQTVSQLLSQNVFVAQYTIISDLFLLLLRWV